MGLLGDDALAGHEPDRLGRTGFADRFVELVNSVASQTPSAVLGLIGPWGSGKTSVLNLVRSGLGDDETWSVVDFNPWMVSDVDGLTREFLATVEAALPAQSSTRAKLSNYASRIAPYTSIASILGLDPSKAFDAAAEHLAGDTSLEAERRSLEKSLEETGQRILVLIDDVDRLQGDELATLLKLVRLVGRLPRVFYVLAYDETTLLDVLGSTDVARDSPARALAYLDKIVQLRLDLPPVPQVLLDGLVDELLEHVLDGNCLTLGWPDTDRLGMAYQEHLRELLTEPRHVKRFFAQVEALYPLVGEEVDFVDFVLVTFVRTFYPEVYRLLRASAAELTGTDFLTGDKSTVDERIDQWQERLTSKEVGLTAGSANNVLGILARMFPRLSRFGGALQKAAAKSISSPEYFGRYLYLSIPPDDVTDAEVRAALDQVSRGSPGQSAASLLGKLEVAGDVIVDKLCRYSPTSRSDARSVLPFAVTVMAQVPDHGVFRRNQAGASIWVSSLMEAADLSDPIVLLNEMLQVVDLREITHSFQRVQKNLAGCGNQLSPEQAAFAALLAERTKQELCKQATRPPSEADGSLGLMLDWSEFTSDSVVRRWVREQLKEGDPWTASEFVGLFLNINISGTTRSAGDMELQLLDRFAGIEFLLEMFSPARDASIIWTEHAAPTWEERLRRAHDALARYVAQRSTTPSEDDLPGA
ncbi:KAP family P-loop NTPase fold protein [Candidatus Microthrix sp.]|uniref:KAP family P-loop NTPase fold protein n=1 Tax=Candidatus Neomicrothrix sp. TaxID=2719034 RepID=UPI0025972E61|nr:P-loop NTPase fold protein [Candidatus Microthrix sp.]HMS47709.1 P-loop NTPase fold protein [Candidatus Microthrix sp.]